MKFRGRGKRWKRKARRALLRDIRRNVPHYRLRVVVFGSARSVERAFGMRAFGMRHPSLHRRRAAIFDGGGAPIIDIDDEGSP